MFEVCTLLCHALYSWSQSRAHRRAECPPQASMGHICSERREGKDKAQRQGPGAPSGPQDIDLNIGFECIYRYICGGGVHVCTDTYMGDEWCTCMYKYIHGRMVCMCVQIHTQEIVCTWRYKDDVGSHPPSLLHRIH